MLPGRAPRPDSELPPEPDHNRAMPHPPLRAVARATTVVALTVFAVAGLSACKESEDAASTLPRPSVAFCRAATKYDNRIQMAKLPEQIELVAKVAEHAPKDVSRDAKTFLDALRKRQAGDASVVDNPRIQTAVDHVNRRAGQDCGWFKRQGM
jgi:hypothetical protein